MIGEEDEETSRVAVGSYEEANEDSELEVLRRFPSLTFIVRSTPRRDDHHIGSLAFFGDARKRTTRREKTKKRERWRESENDAPEWQRRRRHRILAKRTEWDRCERRVDHAPRR